MSPDPGSGYDLVTGGAGFIGSELVRQLIATGRRVVVLDDLSTGKRVNLAGLDLLLVHASVCDAQALAACMAGAERVFHLACLGLRRSLHDPQGGHLVNATGTLLALEAARRASIQRFVHVSSSEIYGSAQSVPMDENHPANPTTPYGAAKLAGEAYARAAFLSYGLPCTIVRPFNTFGPRSHHEGDSGEVIPKFMLRAAAGQPLLIFGDGQQTRDFTFVGDTALGILLAAQPDATLGATMNLGSGIEHSVNALAASICAIANSASPVIHQPPRPGDVRRHLADTGLARRLMGWHPQTAFTNGLRATYHHMMSEEQSLDERMAEDVPRNWIAP